MENITLRQYYAGLAMQGLLSNSDFVADVQVYAVQYADELIAELETTEPALTEAQIEKRNKDKYDENARIQDKAKARIRESNIEASMREFHEKRIRFQNMALMKLKP